jgi:hypothetical protein
MIRIVAAESADKKVAAEVAVVGRIKKARAPIKANDRSQRGLPRSERKGERMWESERWKSRRFGVIRPGKGRERGGAWGTGEC